MGDHGRRRALEQLPGPNAPGWTDHFHQALGALDLLAFRHFKPPEPSSQERSV